MTTATAESPMIILDLPAHPLAKVFSAEVARFIIGRNIARRHLSLRDQIKAAAEMLKLDPDFLPGRKSADKCKALAEFVW
ncbi:MAG TPA: hypothetical protein VG321_07545, partial [Solirubrobacteraceae bacterium]|nr:hypothetical protein [Solirubrobacteraceae bacterium]